LFVGVLDLDVAWRWFILVGSYCFLHLQPNAGIALQIRPLLVTSTCVAVHVLLITLPFVAV